MSSKRIQTPFNLQGGFAKENKFLINDFYYLTDFDNKGYWIQPFI